MDTDPDLSPTTVCVVGFSDFERELLLSYLRHGGRRQLRHRVVASPEAAEVLVVDGDQAGVVSTLSRLGRLRDAVLVGGEPTVAAAAWLMRPLTPEQVLAALSEHRQRRLRPESTTQPLPLGLPPTSRPADLGWPTTMPSVVELPPRGGRRADDRRQPLAAASGPGRPAGTAPALNRPEAPAHGGQGGSLAASRASTAESVTAGPPQPDLTTPVSWSHAPEPGAGDRRRAAPGSGKRQRSKPLVLPRALVVDDSEIALHYLRRLLLPYELVVDTARFAHQALEQMSQRAYGLVFLDVDLGDGSGEDGLKLCRRVRHQLQHPGGRAPIVVMVSSRQSPVDQVRGTLAGAEAYLGKPLDTQALDLLLHRLGFRAQPDSPPSAPPGQDRRAQAPGAGD